MELKLNLRILKTVSDYQSVVQHCMSVFVERSCLHVIELVSFTVCCTQSKRSASFALHFCSGCPRDQCYCAYSGTEIYSGRECFCWICCYSYDLQKSEPSSGRLTPRYSVAGHLPQLYSTRMSLHFLRGHYALFFVSSESGFAVVSDG